MKRVNLLLITIAIIICIPACTAKRSGNKTGSGNISALTGKYWKLTELYGKPYIKDTLSEGEPHIIFRLQDSSLTGNGGCNSLFGKFTLDGKNHISIADFGSTKMACDNMATESDFFQALRSADNLKLAGDTLWLHDVKMEKLAKFVSVAAK